MLLDALQVQLKKDLDTDEIVKTQEFEWDVIDFSADFLWLQIKFAHPEELSTFVSQDFISVTFWDIDLFKS